jgi:predicted NUDIX family NTP pyrophosphohydrolase
MHWKAILMSVMFAATTSRLNGLPESGRTTYFPEIDRAAWFTLPLAREKILESQRPFLDCLEMLWKNASRPHGQKVPV